MIKQVQAEGTSYLYVTDPLSDDLKGYHTKYSFNVFEIYNIGNIDNIRMILEPIKNDGKDYFIFYLYWFVSKDLSELDKKVIDNSYTNHDFENSVKCEYHSGVFCEGCESSWDAFVIDTGNPYIGNKELKQKKLNSVFSRKANLACPKCNTPFRNSLVIKIIGPDIIDPEVFQKLKKW